MRHDLDALQIRARLGRTHWQAPEPLGCDGWVFRRHDHAAIIIASVGEFAGAPWVHASISRPGTMPTYDDVQQMHRAVFGTGWAYQVFTPPAGHISLHDTCLHLWGRLDGRRALPDFGAGGMI